MKLKVKILIFLQKYFTSKIFFLFDFQTYSNNSEHHYQLINLRDNLRCSNSLGLVYGKIENNTFFFLFFLHYITENIY